MRFTTLAVLMSFALLAGCTTADQSFPTAAYSSTIEYRDGMVRSVPSATGCVALTFDDGPHPTLTPRLLSILAEERAVATFFVVGRQVARSPEVVAAMGATGNEIGNHSWSHPALPSLSTAAVIRQIESTDEAIRAITGAAPTLIRMPYGSSSDRVLGLIDRPVIFWTADSNDWNGYSADRIVRTVTGRVGSGSIVLMHDIHPRTISAVRSIIRSLRASGYKFVTVSRLLTGRPCR